MKVTKHKYDEPRILKELETYIEATYGEHYSRNQFQATEFIIDCGHGEGFTIGNVMKYAQRYGKKGGRNRKDLFKVVHYAIMMIYIHDKFYGEVKNAIERQDNGSSKELFNNQYGNDVPQRQFVEGNFSAESRNR